MQYSKIIKSLADTSSRLDKEYILGQHKSEQVFKDILFYALNPFLMFGVKQVPQFGMNPEGATLNDVWADVKNLLDNLAARRLSGHAALNAIQNQLDVLQTDEAELLTNIIRKDLRCGVSEKTANKVFKKLIPTFEVMQTSPMKDAKIKFPCMQEVKFDGLRTIAIYDGIEVQFLSRGGKPFDTLHHFAPDVIKFLGGQPGVLDGEMVSISKNFNEAISGIKRDEANEYTKDIRYVVFEYLTIDEWNNQKCSRDRVKRYAKLMEMFEVIEDENLLVTISRAEIVSDMKMAEENFLKYMDEGHEGAMLKNFDNMYEWKRVKSIGKMKPFDNGDYRVVGFKEGEGKFTGMLGAFIIDFNGVETDVGTGLSDFERADFWNRRGELLDAIIEVEYMEATKSVGGAGGKMRHSRFKSLRSFKGSKA